MAQQSIFKSLVLAMGLKHICTTRLPVLYQPTVGLKQETKLLLDRLKIPERPKKPLTPYFRFLNDTRDAIKRDNPGLKITEITKKCSAAWRALDDSKKANYEVAYKQELEDYTRKYLEYQSKLSNEQRAALQMAKDEKQDERKRRSIKKLYRDTQKPKRPLTSYMIFAMEESKKLQKTPLQIASHLKEKWASLSEQEKQKYQQLAEDSKKKYEEAMAVWERKMQDEGKEHLLRKSVRVIDTTPSRLGRKTKNLRRQRDSSGGSEKNIEVRDENGRKRGLFATVRRIFKA